jgi:hypothetical protein
MIKQRQYQPTATNRDRCEFFRQILPLAFSVNVQRLNCSESVMRQTCTLSVEEVLTEFETARRLQWTAIHRPAIYSTEVAYWEFCVSSLTRSPEDLLIWVLVRPDLAELIFRDNTDIFKK